MKAVLDSSVLFSAFVKASGTTARLFRLARQGRFELCLSATILEETAAGLVRKRDRFDYTREDVVVFVTLLTAVAEVVDDLPPIPPICRDPADDHVLVAALATDTDVIVTGDDDLLSLGHYEQIRIVIVRDFLDSFEEGA